MGRPSDRKRAARHSTASSILRENHREEFDAILADLRRMEAEGLTYTAPVARRPQEVTNPPVAAGGPSEMSEGISSLAASPR